VYGRGGLGVECGTNGSQPVDAVPWASSDVSALGIVGLGGSASEWMLDSARDYADACWWQHPLRGVGCGEIEAPARAVRGGSWGFEIWAMRAAIPLLFEPATPSFLQGLRCSRKGTP